MHRNASTDEIAPGEPQATTTTCFCGCGRSFVPRKSWQRFFSNACRARYHERRTELGVPAKVASNRLLKHGRTGVTLHFDEADRDRASKLEPGVVIHILED